VPQRRVHKNNAEIYLDIFDREWNWVATLFPWIGEHGVIRVGHGAAREPLRRICFLRGLKYDDRIDYPMDIYLKEGHGIKKFLSDVRWTYKGEKRIDGKEMKND